MRKYIALALALLLTGCGFANRHPTQVKVYALIGGATIGGVVGYKARVKFCHYTYDGQPYYGTTCPKPR